MNSPMRPPLAAIVPESAPFTAEQRAWLNGFFAGLLDGDATALSPQDAQALMPGVQVGGAADDDDGAPWHDQTMPLAERMKLAEGRPLRRTHDGGDGAAGLRPVRLRLQGLCGRAVHQEGGAAEPVRAGRQGNRPHAEDAACGDRHGAAPPRKRRTPRRRAAAQAAGPAGTSRDNPVEATFISRTLLNKPGSAKETWHIEFDLTECGLDYQVGDAFGLFPHNDPALADAVLKALGAPPDFPIGGRTLREVLIDGVSLSPAPDMLFQLFSYITGGERRKKAQALSAGEDPDGDAATLDVLAAIEKFSGIRPDPEAFIEALDPLQPRLYSISSSPKVHKGRVSLTVDAVRYDIGKRKRLGVASTFLAGRVAPGDKLRVYVQKAHAFGLPADPQLPIIMVGPGTGVAPFRAFLHERMATKAPGRNWLFFGHQKRDFDFFYEDEFAGMKAAGVLTRLSLAWSRDGDEKFYVQDRMRQVGRELWAGSRTARTSMSAATPSAWPRTSSAR